MGKNWVTWSCQAVNPKDVRPLGQSSKAIYSLRLRERRKEGRVGGRKEGRTGGMLGKKTWKGLDTKQVDSLWAAYFLEKCRIEDGVGLGMGWGAATEKTCDLTKKVTDSCGGLG